MLGKIEGKRRRGWQRMRWLGSITDRHEFEQTLGDGAGQGALVCFGPWGRRVRHDLATEQVWPLNRSLSLFMTTLCLLFPVFWRFSLSPPMAEVSGSPHTPLYVGKQWTVSVHAHVCKHLCLKERGFPSFLCATVLGERHCHRPRFIQSESG